ncbi:hypothetical protein [Nocardia sp. CY41]|uniref:hypothetical protein n=1 Tax=Nocardia sp. CY41 TaxID=2608686 RepID=UPI001356E3A8|nr:hypothetical protein [Nocardia sp. CY41]
MAATAPRKAAARRTAPAAARRPKLAAVPAPEPVDILAEFGTQEKPPVPIKVGKVECDVLRGFSGDQAVEFHRLVGETKFEDLLNLITTNGSALWQVIGEMTPDFASRVLNKLINLSELYEGNLLAPSPGFGMNPAGAQPSQESTATTE